MKKNNFKQRPIEFRVWDTDLNAWLYDFHPDITKNFGDYPQYKITQFTGVLDCDDKKIFEGDILCIAEHLMVYVSCDNWEGFSLKLIGKDGGTIYYNKSIKLKTIGNIFENPEFLKSN